MSTTVTPPPDAAPRRAAPLAAWDARRIFLVGLAVASVAVSLWSLRFLEFSPLELYRGLRESTYFERALPPVFNDPSAPISQTLYQLWRTFLIALAGTGLAAIMSIPSASSPPATPALTRRWSRSHGGSSRRCGRSPTS